MKFIIEGKKYDREEVLEVLSEEDIEELTSIFEDLLYEDGSIMAASVLIGGYWVTASLL